MVKNGATVREVARHAGVSIATVSRVVRGVGQIAPETRRRVLTAIEDLEYRPSHFGRALVERRHAAIGFAVAGFSGPYFFEVINGFESEAVAARLSVVILGTHLLQQPDDQLMETVARVDGVGIFGGAIPDATLERLAGMGVPLVMVAGPSIAGIPTVCTESYGSTLQLPTHLMQVHGYDRLAFIGNPMGSRDISDRWRAFRDAHDKARIESSAQPLGAGLTQADGLRAAAELLEQPLPPRAIVCANDETALGAYAAAAARGVRIPEEVAITGWDDIPMAEIVSPPLTTVRQPMRELGAAAVSVLRDRIRNEANGPSDVLLPTEVVIRASCGCPKVRTSAPTRQPGRSDESKH